MSQQYVSRVFIPALCLNLVCSVCPIHAEPTPRDTLVAQLTPAEQHCRDFGDFAGGVAEDRDRGVPLADTLTRLRNLAATKTPSVNVARDLEELSRLVQILYLAPALSPAQARQSFEKGCLKVAPAPQTTPAPLR